MITSFIAFLELQSVPQSKVAVSIGARRKRSKSPPRCTDDGDDDDAGKGWHAAVVVEGQQGPEHGCEEAAHCGACCCAGALVRWRSRRAGVGGRLELADVGL